MIEDVYKAAANRYDSGMEYARAGRSGIQRFLSFFLKSPMHDYTEGEVPINHLFQQYVMLKNAIREMGGYEADEEID